MPVLVSKGRESYFCRNCHDDDPHECARLQRGLEVADHRYCDCGWHWPEDED